MLRSDQHVLDYVDDYLHELLSEGDADALREHCEKCAICRAALDEAGKRFKALEALPPVEAPERLVKQTVENIAMTDSRRDRNWKILTRTVLATAAAAVLVIGSLHAYYYTLSPSRLELRVLGQRELISGAGTSLRISVVDHRTGRPVPNVPVEIRLYDPRQDTLPNPMRGGMTLAQFTTDSEGGGAPRFDMPADWPDGDYQLVVTARSGRTPDVLIKPIELKRSWKLMVASDKPLYQPGQTIRLRALALRRPDLKPVAGEEVVFLIRDAKGNVIFKQRDVTSRFGITSADCPLASELLEGAYEIECTAGDTTSTRTVQVEKYVLPKFKVAIELDKPFYQPSDEVSGTLRCDYFFGKPVVAGEVKIEVRPVGLDNLNVPPIDKVTDAEGKATFQFRLPAQLLGRPQDGGNARFSLVATVTDTAGQEHSAGTSRVVSAEPIQVEIIPESSTLLKGQANTIYVFASYVDGRPAKARLVVHGISEEIETSDLGVASFEVTPDDDRLGMTVKATDAAGLIGRAHAQLECGNVSGDFLVRTDKAVYDGGETMTVTALGGGVEPVFIDLIKDGQTMLTETVDLCAGSGQAQIDLPPDLFGTLRLVAYRFGADGLPVRKDRTLFVRQARQIAIHATFDADEYRPGQEASLTLRLTDDEGNPVPGAVSLSAVDEAVYSVQNQSGSMERIFFLLEQDLLEPVYAIYDWSPERPYALPLAERTRFEQALFARTAETAAGREAVPAEFLTDEAAAEAAEQPWRPAARPAARNMDRALRGDRGNRVTPVGASPYTLAGNNYHQKVQEIGAQRRTGLRGVTIAWLALAGSLALVGLATFAVYRPKVFLITGAITCGVVVLLAVVSLPAVQSARRAGHRAVGAGIDLQGGMPDVYLIDSSDAMTTSDPAQLPAATNAADSAPPRIREWFPETLLWRPELITDDSGVATLPIELADSITMWRLSASAISAEGQLGGGEFPIRVFQPFFVDLRFQVTLTRNDTVAVPLHVFNYLDQPQTVELTVEQAPWFAPIEVPAAEESNGDSQNKANARRLKLDLGPGEDRVLHYPIRVLKVGHHELTVTAKAGGVADAIRRTIEVVPDGRRVEHLASATLDSPLDMALEVPAGAIEGSVRATVKLHPSAFSQLVEGLDAIFRMPSGCFEQTSSTTYPNVLALDYLRRTGTANPGIEAKSRQYIHVGYQKLLSFEVGGGGFDWFGNPPANRTLTAYGLLEFRDMARVHDVDPALIERTRNWLLKQRARDGSWPAEPGMLNDGLAGSVNRGRNLNLAATAYIAWAVFEGGGASGQAGSTLDYLLAHRPETIDDPYLLAVTAMAIASIDKSEPQLTAWLARLESLKQTDAEGKLVWWSQPEGGRTMFHGGGQSGNIETTAMVALAMLEAGAYPGTTRGALSWLIQQKDSGGTWHSTQATVLALKALLAGTGKPLGGEVERRITLALGGETVREFVIPPDQADVMAQFDLSSMVTSPGQYRVTLTDHTNTGTACQVMLAYHVPEEPGAAPPAEEPLTVNVEYDRERLAVDETVTAVATVTNNMPQAAPMVIVDLPIPGGFVLEPGELDELVGSRKIAKYQITPRKAIVYLLGLQPGEKLELRYRLKATMPVKVAVPPVEAYEYYDPATRGASAPSELEAT